MEDIYYLNHDCIRCLQHIEYIKFLCYINIRLITKLFYFENNLISSLSVNPSKYPNAITRSKSIHITSLKIILDRKESRPNLVLTNIKDLQKLQITTNYSESCGYDFHTLTNLTYLKVKSIGHKAISFNFEHYTNLKYLKLHNVAFSQCATIYFQHAIKLQSLIRYLNKSSKDGYVILHCNSELKYLKLNNIDEVRLYNMTQLKTKILMNINCLVER